MGEIYLDNSATSPPLPEVIDKMVTTLKTNYGNPSSLHNKGLAAEKIQREARKKLAEKLGVGEHSIIFTSGGTESNNLAIKGIAFNYNNRGQHLITSQIEHSSVLNTFRYLETKGFKVTYLPVNNRGIINPNDFKKALKDDTILVSLMHVNNELGSIQPLREISDIIKQKKPAPFFHVDGVQSFGKILSRPKKMGIDLLTVSAHKLHGPKGIGALYCKEGINLQPLLHGGGQEDGIRSGTENMPGLAGFIPALEALPELTPENTEDTTILEIRDYLVNKLNEVKDKLPPFKINTPLEKAAPHILNMSFKNLKGEVIVHSLESDGIYVSTGSACHSQKEEKSEVLEAIGITPDFRDGTIRISLSQANTKKEMDCLVESLIKQLNFLT